ncbi:DNA polymerase III subunit delta, partial [Patescibacteria group bacterium]
MHFLIYGDNTHASRARLASMRARFSETRDSSGMNVVVLHEKKTDLDTIAKHLFASPFLAEKKMVILEGFLKKPAAEQTAIKEYLERKPDSTVVIFYEEAGKSAFKKSTLFTLLEKQKFSSDHPALTAAQVTTHIKTACKENDLEVSPRAVQLLSSSIGDDSWRLDTELGKVITYALAHEKKKVDEEMVHLLVSESQDEPIFTYIDACLEGRGSDATILLEGLRSNGMSDI